MYQHDLGKLLNQLREELGAAGTLSHEARASLRQLADDIDAALQRAGEGQELLHTEHRHRLAEYISHFEAEHPGLVASLRAVMHSLSGAGI